MANDVTVLALISAPQWGLKAGDIGTVDSEAAAGHIAQGYLVIQGEAPARRSRQTPDAGPDVAPETPAEI